MQERGFSQTRILPYYSLYRRIRVSEEPCSRIFHVVSAIIRHHYYTLPLELNSKYVFTLPTRHCLTNSEATRFQ